MLKKLEKILFYLFIFLIPLQTRLILYQFGGDFNEWSSIYLYFTDILLIAVFALWFWRNRKERYLRDFKFQIERFVKSSVFWLVFFIIVSFVSLSVSNNIKLGFYHWVKLLELVGLFFYVKYNLDRSIGFRAFSRLIILSGLFQAIVAIRQFALQRSLGLKILMESVLDIQAAGVANLIVNNTKFIRAYGTLPHANVLAGFLLISIFFVYFLWFSREHLFMTNCFFMIIYGLLMAALLFSFSRTVIIAFLATSVLCFIYCFWQSRKVPGLLKRTVFISTLFIVLCSVFTLMAWPEIFCRTLMIRTDHALLIRSFYNQTALSSISEYPLFGLGMGNFVWNLKSAFNLLSSWAHQPAHNIYLLIASEVGLPGLVFFLFFIFLVARNAFKSRKENNNSLALIFLFCCLLGFLIIGLADHYLWTLQQGQLMLWILLGVIAACYAKTDKGIDEQKII